MRFLYPESLRKSYRRRLRLIARDTRDRLRRTAARNLGPAQFEMEAWAIKAQVLREHQAATADWFVRTMNARNAREFERLTGEHPRFDEADLVRQFRLRQLGVVEALVDKLVRDAIGFYSMNGSMQGFTIRKHTVRADFYAQDQVGVFYNDLTRLRARHVGSDQYVWVRTTSKNPRDHHLDRVGKTFVWGQVEDEPGVLPNCKCTARPVMPRRPPR